MCGAAENAVAEAQQEKAAEPAMVFEVRVHDFGVVLSGRRYTWRFRFRFAKGRVVRIEKVETSCSCTAAVVRLPDGKRDGWGLVEATIRMGDEQGAVDKTVTLHVRAPEPEQVVLTLRARVVKRGFTLEPRRLVVGRLGDSGSVERRVRVRLVTPQRARSVTRVVCSADWIHAGLRGAAAPDSPTPKDAYARVYELRVRVDGRRGPPGHFLEFVTLYSDAPASPYVDLPIKGKIVRPHPAAGG